MDKMYEINSEKNDPTSASPSDIIMDLGPANNNDIDVDNNNDGESYSYR
jgi:hypothetical protein